uniref:Choloylglycine hydrolase/NAAA C-terminal domain-containing protein n=1 Tax=Globisporangium ultimum (strain ATCC 200006 / CBS 805.95 / DAOM BR144) TaxID=431595 RepID=K3XCF9_GLOUD
MKLSTIARLHAASALLLGLLGARTDACSDFLLNTTTDSVVSGRTMDFDADLASVVEVIPRGTSFQELPVYNCPECPDYQWESKYGFIGFNMFGFNIAADGMNEKGLSAAELYLIATEYPTPETTPSGSKDLDAEKPIVTSICTYILGNYATVDEVREGLKHIQIAETDGRIAAALLGKSTGLGRTPLHISIHDADGKNLVLEFIHGKVTLYDNVNAVLTNDPPLNKQLDKLHKNGFETYPGGYQPTERFLRLSALNHLVPYGYPHSPSDATYLVATEEQRAISDTLHLLNTVVRPPSLEATEWSIVRDHGRKKLYIRSTTNQLLRLIDLNQLDLSDRQSRRLIPVTFGNWYVDATGALLDESNTARTVDLPARTKIEALIESHFGNKSQPHMSLFVDQVKPESTMMWAAAASPAQTSSGSVFVAGCVCGGLLTALVTVGSQKVLERMRRQGYQGIADSNVA